MKAFQAAIAAELIAGYKFDQPFHLYFTNIARQHKNWGSKDRKTYRNACYAFFRTGFFSKGLNLESEIQSALELVSMDAKSIEPIEIFPYPELISNKINFNDWAISHLTQKPAYLVTKPDTKDLVLTHLSNNAIDYELIDGLNLVKVKADSKCDVIVDSGWAWIMDRASAEATDALLVDTSSSIWDACSGAGGKALFLRSKFGSNLDLTCSDKRFSVLDNLEKRFRTLGFKLPMVELADLTEDFHISKKYDSILLDVPCTGSGTWGRSPEFIRTFDLETPQKYAKLQKDIVRHALKNLKPGGKVHYMTCSVFKAENEENVEHFCLNHGLKLIQMSYHHNGHLLTDTLFRAEFIKV
ncbi:MAG TPA: hypothetical protein VGF79_07470 [Bacteroidia bacterium]